MKKKICVLAATVLAFGMISTGCGSSGAPAGTTAAGTTASEAAAETSAAAGSGSNIDTTGYLVTALKADIQTADVHKTTKDYQIPMNIYDRLVDIDVSDDGVSSITPSLAESWEISDDGLEYTFHLRHDVKYHNGKDFTAEDVAYSISRMLTVEGATNADFVNQIKGADELFDGTATELSGLEVIDDYTVKMTLKEAYAGFLACLSTPGVSIYDSETTEAAGDQFGLDPSVTVGTGPFKFTGWTVNDQLVLTRNDDYWRGAAELPGVVVKIVGDTETQSMMFESGQLDIIDLDFIQDSVDHFMTTYPDQIVSGPRVAITYFTLNEDIAPFDNVDVRKAVQMSIDRQAILDALYGGRGAVENGIYPQGLIGFNADITPINYDPEGAKALLSQAGYPNGFDMELSADSSASDTINMALEIIKEQLAQVGINAEIKTYDESTWLATRRAGTLGSFMSTWTADYNDPDNFIYTFFGNEDNTKARSLNYKDADVMTRVQEARAIVNNDERLAEYSALETKIVSEDAAWVPMFSRTHLFAVGKNIEGFKVAWNGISDTFFYGIKKN